MDIVYTSKESDICLIVLYSLAKTSFLRQKLYYKDLQNICFVDNNILMKIIKHLEKFHVIRKVGTNYDENRLIVLVSKYWEKHLFSFTRLLLDSSVVHNLDTHFDIKDSRNYIFDSSYDEYQSGLKILKRILCASLGVCVIVNVNNYLKCSELMDYEFFAVLNIISYLNNPYGLPEAIIHGALAGVGILVSALLILVFYNGKRAEHGRNFSKWFFYIFYPGHLLILVLLKMYVFV